MENLQNIEVQDTHFAQYPEQIKETKSIVSPQALLWALIAVVLYVIYYQQPDKDNALCLVQLTLIGLCALLAIVKFLAGDRKLTYIPTGSLVVREERYYNIALEGDIRQCLREDNMSRLNALRTDDAGGIMVETLESKDKLFTAMRMQKYCPEGYRPETKWMVMRRALDNLRTGV